jgi:hypothetical protein
VVAFWLFDLNVQGRRHSPDQIVIRVWKRVDTLIEEKPYLPG